MNQRSPIPIKQVFASFIGMGIFIVLFVIGLIFFSYLLIIGGIIGLILFGIAYLRARFLSYKMKKQSTQKEHSGRTIDQS